MFPFRNNRSVILRPCAISFLLPPVETSPVARRLFRLAGTYVPYQPILRGGRKGVSFFQSAKGEDRGEERDANKTIEIRR